MLPVELLQLNSRYNTYQEQFSVVWRIGYRKLWASPTRKPSIYTEINLSNNYETISIVKIEIFLIYIDKLNNLISWKSSIYPGLESQKNLIRFFMSKVFIQGCPQGFPPRLPPRFPPKVSTRLYLWFPQGKYLRQSPLNFLQNRQSQFLLLILLLVCDFIFLVFFFLVTAISAIFVLFLSQNYHFKFPLKCPQDCP